MKCKKTLFLVSSRVFYFSKHAVRGQKFNTIEWRNEFYYILSWWNLSSMTWGVRSLIRFGLLPSMSCIFSCQPCEAGLMSRWGIRTWVLSQHWGLRTCDLTWISASDVGKRPSYLWILWGFPTLVLCCTWEQLTEKSRGWRCSFLPEETWQVEYPQ